MNGKDAYLDQNLKPLNKLEVKAIIQEEIDPFKLAIDPASAPYLSVDHFFTTITIMLVVFSAILGHLWLKMNSNNKSINDRVTSSSLRLHGRVDDTNQELEDKENSLRKEFVDKHNRLDDRLWELKGGKKDS